MSAQTWNPDADFDNVIGVNDLMELLSVFGTEWTATYPQDPAYELAAYYAGYIDYWDCVRTCKNNHAKIIGLHEYAMFEDSIIADALVTQYTHYWLDDKAHKLTRMVVNNYSIGSVNFYGAAGLVYQNFHLGGNCVCTGLVPVVE